MTYSLVFITINILDQYDELVDKVNKKKIKTLVNDILAGVINDIPINVTIINLLKDILKQTRRYPWLKVWLDASKTLA